MSDNLPEPRPLNLIERAIEKGYSKEDLKTLFELYNQHNSNLAREAFHRAMHSAQDNMPTVVHDSENSPHPYARLETIQAKCRKVWMDEGLALSFSEEDCHLPEHKRTVCHVRHTAGHKEEFHLDLPVDGIGPKGSPIGGMNRIQGAISTGSYAQRILITRIFNITIARTDLDGSSPFQRISPEQVEQIQAQLSRTGVRLTFFLKWVSEKVGAQLEAISDMPVPVFAEALDMLKRTSDRPKGRTS